MLVETAHIDRITGSRYDRLLASGWFRSREIIYRSDLICMDERVSSVRHIRYDLNELEIKKRHKKLLSKNDKRFSVRVSSVVITSDTERLYHFQTKRFKGFIHSHVEEVVFPFSTKEGNGTLQLDVYDNENLVASSFFDIGKNAAASIHCVYDQPSIAFTTSSTPNTAWVYILCSKKWSTSRRMAFAIIIRDMFWTDLHVSIIS